MTVGGVAMVGEEVGTIIGEDLARAEMLAFPIIFLLSLWVFRGVIAALLPSLMGALVIFGSFLAIGLTNEVTGLSVYALNLAIGLSLGLAIDYSLLITRATGRRWPGADRANGPCTRTLQTAGKSVLFSAITVAAALAGLMVFPQRFLFSMGLAGVMVALIAAAVALLVLPAVLALLGPRVNSLAPKSWKRRSEEEDQEITSGFWYRLSNAVMRRPGADRDPHHGRPADRGDALPRHLRSPRSTRASCRRARPPARCRTRSRPTSRRTAASRSTSPSRPPTPPRPRRSSRPTRRA